MGKAKSVMSLYRLPLVMSFTWEERANLSLVMMRSDLSEFLDWVRPKLHQITVYYKTARNYGLFCKQMRFCLWYASFWERGGSVSAPQAHEALPMATWSISLTGNMKNKRLYKAPSGREFPLAGEGECATNVSHWPYGCTESMKKRFFTPTHRHSEWHVGRAVY